MEISINKENERLTAALSGRLDSSNAPELEAKLKENLADISELVFDFAKLDYLSSAGLRVLLASHKRLSGSMRVVNANEAVLDIFRITGMINVLNIE